MYVDDTMITGHLDHARFSGERCGRILNRLFRSHSVFRTGGSTRSLGRILSGEPRSETSQARVGCGLQGRPPAGIVHEARESAQGTSVFLAAAEPLAQGSKKKAGSRCFWQKGLLWGLLGLESGEIDFYTNSSTYARPFSRTIPVRTPQSASRTEESKSWMSRGLVADRRSYPHATSALRLGLTIWAVAPVASLP